jgi:hypothetical protein
MANIYDPSSGSPYDTSGYTQADSTMMGSGSGGASSAALGGGSPSSGSMPSGGMGVAGVISAVGTAYSDYSTAVADQKSAGEYDAAAEVALQNENIVKGSLITQTSQAQRQFNMTQGAQTSQIAAAGFNPGSTTAQYLQKNNQNQFNVNMNTITGNAVVQEQGYASQATADENAAKAAMAASGGSMMGAAFSTVSAIAQVAQMA